MKFSKKNYLLVFIFFVFVISGCGGEPAFNGGGCNDADTPTNISSFSITGSTTAGSTEVINDTADFTVSWDLTSSCTYTYQVYLAVADVQNPAFDVVVASGTCGLGFSCSESVDFDCSFDATAKTMACNGGSSVDVSALLADPSPKNRYFILTASNEMLDSDFMASNQVRIDF